MSSITNKMVPLFVSFLLCMLIPMAVNADVCGGTSGPTCNASALYTEFETVYLAASTSDSPQGLCVRLTRQENQAAAIVSKFENGTQAGEDTESFAYTSEPDKLIITFGSEPNTPHEVQVPYADSEACFVAKFTDASYDLEATPDYLARSSYTVPTVMYGLTLSVVILLTLAVGLGYLSLLR
ncbi:uncharacterized protein LOC144146531 [Haemaphysalis longicornis]